MWVFWGGFFRWVYPPKKPTWFFGYVPGCLNPVPHCSWGSMQWGWAGWQMTGSFSLMVPTISVFLGTGMLTHCWCHSSTVLGAHRWINYLQISWGILDLTLWHLVLNVCFRLEFLEHVFIFVADIHRVLCNCWWRTRCTSFFSLSSLFFITLRFV